MNGRFPWAMPKLVFFTLLVFCAASGLAADVVQSVVFQWDNHDPLKFDGLLKGEIILQTTAGEQTIPAARIAKLELATRATTVQLAPESDGAASGTLLRGQLTLATGKHELKIDLPLLTRLKQRQEGLGREQEAIAWLQKMGAKYSLQEPAEDGSPTSRLDDWLGRSVTSVDLRYEVIPDLGAVRTRKQAGDITPLAALSRLTFLDVSGTEVSDLGPLSELKNLESLYASCTPVTDLAPLARLSNLKSLDLVGARRLSDVTPLGALKSLQDLRLRRTDVSDLTPLGALPNVERLELTSAQVKDLSPLAQWTKLTWLDTVGIPATDLTPLGTFSTLESLFVSYQQIDTLPPARLINLKLLHVDSGSKSGDTYDPQKVERAIAAIRRALPKCHVRLGVMGYGIFGHP